MKKVFIWCVYVNLQNMYETAQFSGQIYTADKNFTRPPVAAVATYFNSGKKFHNYLGMVGHSLRQFFPSAYTVCSTILQKMINLVKWSNMLYNNEMTFTLKSLGPLTATRKSLDVLSPRKIHSPFRFFYDTCFSDLVIRSFTAITFSQRCKKQRLHAFSTSHSYFFACLVIHSFRFCINLILNQFPLDFLVLMFYLLRSI